MTWKSSVPLGVGIFLSVIAVLVVGSAMFLTDKGEEMVHLYKDYRKASGPSAPMELQGKWQDLTLVPLGGPTARALGVGDLDRGVVVADVPEGSRGRQAGLLPGDTVVGVDNQPVRDLSDLYSVSQAKAWSDPLLLDVRRQGQVMTVFLPGPQGPPGVALPEVEAQAGWPSPAPGIQAGWGGQQYYCPQHGMVMPAGSPGVGYACPHCRGPLHLYHRNQLPVR